MIIKVFRLNRKKQEIQFKDINLNQFKAFIATGYSIELLRVKGRPTKLFNTAWFDNIAIEQRNNDEAVEHRAFSYIYNGDGRKISDKLRDDKGRPLRKYTQPEDMLGKIAKYFFYKGDDIFKYAEEQGLLFDEYEYYGEELFFKRRGLI